MLEQLFAFARSTAATLFIDGAETLFAGAPGVQAQRAKVLGDYLRRVLPTAAGALSKRSRASARARSDRGVARTVKRCSRPTVCSWPTGLPLRPAGSVAWDTR
mgnify:CR=1 FL=1